MKSLAKRYSFAIKEILIVCVWIAPLSLFAQNYRVIDSLSRQLKHSVGEERFQQMLGLSWEYRFSHPDSTIIYGNKAYSYGIGLGLKNELANPLNYVGVAYNYKGDRLNAITYHKKAIEIASAQHDSTQLGHANNSIGRVYYDQGMMKNAFDYFLIAESIFKNLNDLSGRAYVYQSIGNVYRAQYDFKEALDYYFKAQQLREQLGDKRDIMSGLIMLGRLHKDQKQFIESNEFLQKARMLGTQLKSEVLLAEVDMVLSDNYYQLKQFKEAESAGLRAFEAFSKIDNVRLIPGTATVLGKIYLSQNRLAEAEKYLKKAIETAIRIKQAVLQREAYLWLWRLAEKKGDQQSALIYQNKYLIMNDSTKRIELAREVDRLQFQVEVEKKERENELLKVTELKNAALIREQDLQNLTLIITTVATSVIIFLLILNSRRRRKTLRQLAVRNQVLVDLNNEKDTLMNIVVHDLKSPFNNIRGLSNLMKMDGDLNEAQARYLELIRNSTQSGLEMITDLLDAHAMESDTKLNVEKINLNAFVSLQLNSLEQSAIAKQITIQQNVQGDFLYTDKEYLSRILDNLVSNAIKFSPPASTISVTAIASEGSSQFFIKDQGQGFSEADIQNMYKKFKKLSSRPTAGESSNGLGLAIVKILVDRLSGRIELKSKKGEGSEFIVTIPDLSNK